MAVVSKLYRGRWAPFMVTPFKADLAIVIEKAKHDSGASSRIAWQIFDASIVQGVKTSLYIALQLCHSLTIITLALQLVAFLNRPFTSKCIKIAG